MMQRIVYLLKIQTRMILIQETFYQLHLLQNTYCLKNDRDYHHIIFASILPKPQEPTLIPMLPQTPQNTYYLII